LRRLALPIGHQVQRRWACATLSLHLILNHFQREAQKERESRQY
jgi:hypothetical protein